MRRSAAPWYHNLVANPAVTVPRVERFGTCEQKTDRVIPVVALSVLDAGDLP